jgi:hypothetical protein
MVIISRRYDIRVKLAIHDHGGHYSKILLSVECKASFILRVRANVQPESSIPIGAKVEISPQGRALHYVWVKAEIEKIFSICPKLLINAELYGLVLAPKLEKKKRIPLNLGSQFGNPWGQCSIIYQYPKVNVLAFISNLRPNIEPKLLKIDPKNFRPWVLV